MDIKTFDTLARQAGGSLSRRSSLIALGGAGFAALAAAPLAAGKNKKQNKKRKSRKKEAQPECPPLAEDCNAEVDQTCARQEEECNAFFAPLCEEEGSPENCAEALAVCCASLGTCRATAFLDCFMTTIRMPTPGSVP